MKNNLGRSVFAACIVGMVLALLSGGCASERPQAAVRAKASPAAGPTDTSGKVRAAAYGAVPTPADAPKDKNLLSLKDRLKIPLVRVALKYERFNVDQAVLSYRLTEKQEQLQRKGFANREATAKKLLDLKERFEAETGLLVEEAAALFPQVPAQGGKK